MKILAFLLSLLFAAAASAATVKTGAQVAAEAGFSSLAGKRVGLITNHTAVVEDEHLVDMIHRSDKVALAALFAPEHGLRGLQEDGVHIPGGIDERTGVKIFSLYGTTKKPTEAMLDGVDLLVYDIQDVGARFYTYISTMGLAMQAAAAAGIPFVVLDRPNPLGGEYVAGPLVEKGFISFVGQFPIPIAHGMTVGELALMIKGERMLPGLERLDLRVVKMEGWQRGMQWPDTGLQWIRTSPNLPDFETALLYPGMCFLEATIVSEGRGTLDPFQLVGAPWLDEAFAKELCGKMFAGVSAEAATYIPRLIPGMSSRPKYRNRLLDGARLVVKARHEVRPVELGVALLSAVYGKAGMDERERFFQKPGFDLLAGSDRLRNSLIMGVPAEQIIASWKDDERLFREMRRPYLLY